MLSPEIKRCQYSERIQKNQVKFHSTGKTTLFCEAIQLNFSEGPRYLGDPKSN